MTSIAEALKENKDWIIVELNPELDLMNGLAAQLSNHPLCREWFRQAKLNLSWLGLDLEISGEPPITDLQTAVTRMLESIKRYKKNLLITIDEVTDTTQMRVFAAAYQILAQQFPCFTSHGRLA